MNGRENALRVIHVLRSLEFGGAETLVLDLARLQRESGRISPSLACLAGLGELDGRARALGLPVEVVGFGTIRYLSAILRFRRLFARERPGVVHTHNFLSHVHAAPAARLLGIPVVHTKHGKAVTSFRWSKRFRRFLYELADSIVVVSRETGESFRAKTGVPAAKTIVIHNGIDLARFASLDRAAARRSLGIPESAAVVGCVSRLDPVKDHGTMLRAFAKAIAGRPGVSAAAGSAECDVMFLIVGEGPERPRIEGLIAELGLGVRVRLAGFTAEVPRHLAAMDLFLQPSTEEGLSLTLLEAAAAGVPIAASAVGGTPEVVEDGVTGTLVPPGDVERLAEAIGEYLRAPERHRRMAASARERVMKEFSLEGMAERYEALYRGVVARRG